MVCQARKQDGKEDNRTGDRSRVPVTFCSVLQISKTGLTVTISGMSNSRLTSLYLGTDY